MFCYSVIKVLCFLSKTLSYIITFSYLCQELFFKNFFFFLRSPFSLSNVNFYMLSHDFQSVKKFFRFLLRFLSFFFQKCVSHVQRILYYHNSRVASSIFWRFFILSTSTRYCIFSVFLSFTLHIRLIELLFFYQYLNINNINLQK